MIGRSRNRGVSYQIKSAGAEGGGEAASVADEGGRELFYEAKGIKYKEREGG